MPDCPFHPTHTRSALGHALERLEHSEERDILHTHYTDIAAELQAKTEALRQHRQRVRTLEREVTDVQAEFELDRADYLETIRRLQKRLRFYEQLTERALPLLRRDGRFWDPAEMRAASVWNDDLGRWRIPEQVWGRVRLPPAGECCLMNVCIMLWLFFEAHQWSWTEY